MKSVLRQINFQAFAITASILACVIPAAGAAYFWLMEQQFRYSEAHGGGINSFPAQHMAEQFAELAVFMVLAVTAGWHLYWKRKHKFSEVDARRL
jgi:hypothetical protein